MSKDNLIICAWNYGQSKVSKEEEENLNERKSCLFKETFKNFPKNFSKPDIIVVTEPIVNPEFDTTSGHGYESHTPSRSNKDYYWQNAKGKVRIERVYQRIQYNGNRVKYIEQVQLSPPNDSSAQDYVKVIIQRATFNILRYDDAKEGRFFLLCGWHGLNSAFGSHDERIKRQNEILIKLINLCESIAAYFCCDFINCKACKENAKQFSDQSKKKCSNAGSAIKNRIIIAGDFNEELLFKKNYVFHV